MIDIRRIDTHDPLYTQARRLREDVILAPLGLDLARFDQLNPGLEDRAEHFVGVTAHPRGPRVVACAMLIPADPRPASGRVAQVAIDPQRQGEGIGRRLMATLESRAFGDLGLIELYCEANKPAIGFYEALGWKAEDAGFDMDGIPHQRMVLRDRPASPGATGPSPSA